MTNDEPKTLKEEIGRGQGRGTWVEEYLERVGGIAPDKRREGGVNESHCIKVVGNGLLYLGEGLFLFLIFSIKYFLAICP